MLELDRMQGTWQVTALEVQGSTLPAQSAAGAKIVVTGDKFLTTGMGAEYGGYLTGDSTVTPCTMDMNFTSGPHAGKASLAIYELNAEEWRLCLCLAGGTRPSEFKTTPGSGHVLEVLSRESSTAKHEGSEAKQPQESAQKTDETPGFAASPDDPDLDLISGNWTMVSGIRNGESLPNEFSKYGRRIATRTEITVQFGPQVFLKANYRINSANSPKTMEYVLLDGGEAGSIQRGIYKLEGDLLTTFMTIAGGDAPLEFDPKPEDGRMYSVWKRIG